MPVEEKDQKRGRESFAHQTPDPFSAPETVLLRLIDSKGAPNVKIAATEDGSAISFGGEANPTHIQVLARGKSTSLRLVNQDGRKQVIKPQ